MTLSPATQARIESGLDRFTDTRRCLADQEHHADTRHTPSECPADPADLPSLAAMREAERESAEADLADDDRDHAETLPGQPGYDAAYAARRDAEDAEDADQEPGRLMVTTDRDLAVIESALLVFAPHDPESARVLALVRAERATADELENAGADPGRRW